MSLQQLIDLYGSGSRRTKRFVRWVEALPVSNAVKGALEELSPAGEIGCGSCTLFDSSEIMKYNQYLRVVECGLVIVGSSGDGDFVVMRSLSNGYDIGFVPHDFGSFYPEPKEELEVYFVRVAKDLEEYITLWNKEGADDPAYDFWNAIKLSGKCLVFKNGGWSETTVAC